MSVVPAVYQIAGLQIFLDVELKELAGFRSAPKALPLDEIRDEVAEPHDERCLFDGEGHVLGRERRVRTTYGPMGYSLDVESSPRIAISASGSRIAWALGLSSQASEEAARVAVLGPGLLLAMAELGTFALHASCAVFGGVAVLFVGQSGAGKSTLASELSRSPGWRRLTDDVTPILGHDVDPAYPQLKLDERAASEAVAHGPARLAAVYGLDVALDVSIAPVSPRAGHRLVVSQTVAARLFAPTLLARHHRFAGELVQRVPVRALRYPRRKDALAEVRDLLERDISALG